MIHAAIDIGTNTMLLLVCEVQPSKRGSSRYEIIKTIASAIEYPRLGVGVHKLRAFSDEAMERALACFKKYKKICDEKGAQSIRAIATSASRDSKNAIAFYEKVKAETGIEVQIIPGETEARLSFLGGLLEGFDPDSHAILDIGGGSTEFVVKKKNSSDVHGQSIDMGCVRATELYLKEDPYSKKSLVELENALKQQWATLDSALQAELRKKDWVAIAGTPTTLAAVMLGLSSFLSDKVDGFRIGRCEVGDLYESLATQSEEQRKNNPVIGEGRSDVIVAGAAILFTAMEFFEKPEIIVSSRGLRHGVITSGF